MPIRNSYSIESRQGVEYYIFRGNPRNGLPTLPYSFHATSRLSLGIDSAKLNSHVLVTPNLFIPSIDLDITMPQSEDRCDGKCDDTSAGRYAYTQHSTTYQFIT